MRALLTAVIYLGSFLAIGLIAKMAARRWIDGSGTNLTDLQAQVGTKRRKHKAFLFGRLAERRVTCLTSSLVTNDCFYRRQSEPFIGSNFLPHKPLTRC